MSATQFVFIFCGLILIGSWLGEPVITTAGLVYFVSTFAYFLYFSKEE